MRALAVRVAICVLIALCHGPAGAQQKDDEAKAAYLEGKAAYEQKRFDRALDRFQRAYVLSAEPALLYNIASTLQQLQRPRDAVEALRTFLRARPGDPNREEIEQRIVALEAAQRLLERDEAQRAKVAERERARAAAAGAQLGVVEVDRRVAIVSERERARRRRLAIGLGVGLGLVLAGGVTAGVVCGLGKCSSTPARDYDFDPVTGTR